MENRVNPNSDYWYDVILGGILAFLILYLCGVLVLSKLKLDFLNIYYLVFCLAVVVFYQWKDDNLKVIETKLSKKENFELTKQALEKINWNYKESSTEISLTYNKFLLKFLNVTIIPKSQKICFNFKYHSTTRTGRLPFYLGISTIMEWIFKRSLKSLINKKPNA